MFGAAYKFTSQNNQGRAGHENKRREGLGPIPTIDLNMKSVGAHYKAIVVNLLKFLLTRQQNP
jgi:hypothetical protein